MEKLFFGLLIHFVGDYLLQNDWMAVNKTRSNKAAFIHASLYSLPFLVVCDHPLWFIIFVTHYFIDRYRLAVYWIRLVNWTGTNENCGYGKDKPSWMAVWLMIIIDNTIHVCINSVCIFLAN